MGPFRASPAAHRGAPSPLAGALGAFRGTFLAVACFSGVVNVLLLSGSLFMLQVYDRVLPSRSLPTLVALVALVALLYAFQGVFEVLRGRMLVRLGRALDERIAPAAYRATVQGGTRGPAGGGLRLLRDLDQLRGFLSGLGPSALFDLPWMPLYILLCFAFHPWIGAAALTGAVLLVALALAAELLGRKPAAAAGASGAERLARAESARRNAEAIHALGMLDRFVAAWGRPHRACLDAQQRAADIAGGLGACSRVLRMMLQSAVLAVGAWLVIRDEATAGIMIASSILTSRALAPVELAIAHWRGFLAARQSWARLAAALPAGAAPAPLPLPAPERSLAVDGLAVAPPGAADPVLRDVSFRLDAGDGLGIVGPSASGKSSLARALVGVWPAARGTVRLDDAALDQWAPERLGAHIGYLPQDIELFDGTVAENIARFDPAAEAEAILAAAREADVHEMILRLPDGYGTRIGEGGAALSAGQRQRIGLARALYGAPFLVVLDEPNSNLDADGDRALTQAILGVRRRGGIAVVIAHRRAALAGVDRVLALSHGRVRAFGPREEALRAVLRAPGETAPREIAGAAE
jgi:ATP-binding cassette subfamily C protein